MQFFYAVVNSDKMKLYLVSQSTTNKIIPVKAANVFPFDIKRSFDSLVP